MARVRNYAAEYARRVALERERAAAEGRTPSSARARGHRDQTTENTRARVWRLARKLRAPDTDTPDGTWRSDVETSLRQLGPSRTEALLRQQEDNTAAYLGGSAQPGSTDWSGRGGGDLYGTISTIPESMYWYHGILG